MAEATTSMRRLVTTPVTAGLLLLVVYGLLSLATDADGYLGTDTGAKVLTLEVMTDEGTASPDIGYWAEDLDPAGRVHPVHQTKRRADGSWVAVTTLPMLEAARPLYATFGYRGTLLLPMLGGVAAAFAARAVGRRLDADIGWPAFWIVGLASPVLVYALDFWEHAAGVACILGAVALLLGVRAGRAPWTAVAAGALLGAGAAMRQEVLVYALVMVSVTCVVLLWERRSLVAPALTGLAAVVGFAVPFALNDLLESAIEGNSRAARSTGVASSAVGSASADVVRTRIEEGAQTLLGLVAGRPAVSALLGLAVVGAVAIAARAERRGDETLMRLGLVGAAAVYLADAAGGLGFIPGTLVAFPLAIGGLLALSGGRDTRVIVGIALGSLPIVYAFQYLGGASPQWGGRYTLASGALLGIAALVHLRDRQPQVLRGLVVLSALATALGFAWMVERTHGADAFFDELVAEAEPVVISRQAFLLREGGAVLQGRRWLSAENESEFALAVDIARDAGEERFTVLEWEGEAPPADQLPDDVTEVRRTMLEFVNTPVGAVTYEFED